MGDDINEILKRYGARLDEELGPGSSDVPAKISSEEYEKFRKEMMPKAANWYEKACNFSEKLFQLSPSKEEAEALQCSINTSHLNITPTGATTFAVLAPLVFAFTAGALSFIIPGLLGKPTSVFFLVVSLLVAVILMFPLKNYPHALATTYRMKASNEMVLCIFYLVTYMRHTSNLELAIKFASDHLTGPLALDLKKVLWDVETEKFSSVKASMDSYLEQWRKYNLEFIESFHLVESSLYESTEPRRIEMLEKALDVILDETYEKMLHYAQNLKSPITMLHMLGIILPILGLVLLPLMVSFMGGVKWYYIAVFYNILLPIGVFYLGITILVQRPTGYGDVDITKMVPSLGKYKNIIFKIGGREVQLQPIYFCVIIGGILFLIAMVPLLLHFLGAGDFGWGQEDPTSSCGRGYCLLDYREDPKTESLVGPFGLGAALLGMFFPISIAFGIGLYKRLRSKNVIEIREKAKQLENEFASGLFQLGNRLGDGIPAESAFGRVATMMEGTTSGKFFETVSININKLGMSVEEAIFNPKNGAILSFPSNMITSSMKVLVQSVKKGPKIAAQALVNMSRYIKEMHRVEERLKDILEDVISSMKSQVSFMTPAIAGIVVGITSMITNILGKLGPLISQSQEAGGGAPMGAGFEEMFGLGIPTYYFQIVVGLYVVQIIYILTYLVNGIENGADTLNETYLLGKNLIKSTVLYIVIAVIITLVFNIVANMVIGNIFGGGI